MPRTQCRGRKAEEQKPGLAHGMHKDVDLLAGHGLASDSSFNEIYPDAVHPSRLTTPPVAHTVTALEDDQSRSMGKPLHAGEIPVCPDVHVKGPGIET